MLLGPTGSGKTPLGRLLELRGLKGRRCIHFDFGRILRTCIVEINNQLNQEEIRHVRELLRAGALLEDKDFIIAEKLLLNFVAERKVDRDTLVVLNGLPRHVGQAIAIEQLVDVQMIIRLECTPDVVLGRIQMNIDGDRAGRDDNTLDKVRQRIELFKERTEPLLDYYRSFMLPIIDVNVGVKTTAQDIYEQIEVHLISIG